MQKPYVAVAVGLAKSAWLVAAPLIHFQMILSLVSSLLSLTMKTDLPEVRHPAAGVSPHNVKCTVMVIWSTNAASALSVTESTTPKLDALMSAAVHVSPHRSLVPPYVFTVSTVGHVATVSARSVAPTTPAFTRRSCASLMVPESDRRSIFTSMPRI